MTTKLPEHIARQIEEEAEVYSDAFPSLCKTEMREGYIAGATSMAERCLELVEALNTITALSNSWIIAETTVNCKHTYGDIRVTARQALAKWSGE